MKFYLKFLILFLLFNLIFAQKKRTTTEEVPDTTTDSTTVSSPPVTRPGRATTTTTPETTTQAINFTDPILIDGQIKEALDVYYNWALENLEEFKKDTRDRFDEEMGRMYDELEKDEFYNLYEGKCPPDQLTTFDAYESDLDAIIKVYMEHEIKKIDEVAMTSFNKFNTLVQDYVKINLVTPLTSALRFNKIDRHISIPCANFYVPLIEELIESTYTGVVECYQLFIFYNETEIYQEIVNNLYRETASLFTTCTNAACFKKACPKTHLLVLRVAQATTNAMTSIIENLKEEVADMEKCVKDYHASFITSSNAKNSLRNEILSCLKP